MPRKVFDLLSAERDQRFVSGFIKSNDAANGVATVEIPALSGEVEAEFFYHCMPDNIEDGQSVFAVDDEVLMAKDYNDDWWVVGFADFSPRVCPKAFYMNTEKGNVLFFPDADGNIQVRNQIQSYELTNEAKSFNVQGARWVIINSGGTYKAFLNNIEKFSITKDKITWKWNNDGSLDLLLYELPGPVLSSTKSDYHITGTFYRLEDSGHTVLKSFDFQCRHDLWWGQFMPSGDNATNDFTDRTQDYWRYPLYDNTSGHVLGYVYYVNEELHPSWISYHSFGNFSEILDFTKDVDGNITNIVLIGYTKDQSTNDWGCRTQYCKIELDITDDPPSFVNYWLDFDIIANLWGVTDVSQTNLGSMEADGACTFYNWNETVYNQWVNDCWEGDNNYFFRTKCEEHYDYSSDVGSFYRNTVVDLSQLITEGLPSHVDENHLKFVWKGQSIFESERTSGVAGSCQYQWEGGCGTVEEGECIFASWDVDDWDEWNSDEDIKSWTSRYPLQIKRYGNLYAVKNIKENGYLKETLDPTTYDNLSSANTAGYDCPDADNIEPMYPLDDCYAGASGEYDVTSKYCEMPGEYWDTENYSDCHLHNVPYTKDYENFFVTSSVPSQAADERDVLEEESKAAFVIFDGLIVSGENIDVSNAYYLDDRGSQSAYGAVGAFKMDNSWKIFHNGGDITTTLIDKANQILSGETLKHDDIIGFGMR